MKFDSFDLDLEPSNLVLKLGKRKKSLGKKKYLLEPQQEVDDDRTDETSQHPSTWYH